MVCGVLWFLRKVIRREKWRILVGIQIPDCFEAPSARGWNLNIMAPFAGNMTFGGDELQNMTKR